MTEAELDVALEHIAELGQVQRDALRKLCKGNVAAEREIARRHGIEVEVDE